MVTVFMQDIIVHPHGGRSGKCTLGSRSKGCCSNSQSFWKAMNYRLQQGRRWVLFFDRGIRQRSIFYIPFQCPSGLGFDIFQWPHYRKNPLQFDGSQSARQKSYQCSRCDKHQPIPVCVEASLSQWRSPQHFYGFLFSGRCIQLGYKQKTNHCKNSKRNRKIYSFCY